MAGLLVHYSYNLLYYSYETLHAKLLFQGEIELGLSCLIVPIFDLK